MKRTALLAIALITAMLILASCNTNTPGAPSDADVAEVCAALTERTAAEHSKVTLSTTVVAGGTSLLASYVVTGELVTYKTEALNLLPPELGAAGTPADHKSVRSGTATVKDGTVTHLDGDEVTLPEYTELRGAFTFDGRNMRDVNLSDTELRASIISASVFLGGNVNATDMRLIAEYGSADVLRITLEYTTDGVSVVTVYEFEA